MAYESSQWGDQPGLVDAQGRPIYQPMMMATQFGGYPLYATHFVTTRQPWWPGERAQPIVTLEPAPTRAVKPRPPKPPAPKVQGWFLAKLSQGLTRPQEWHAVGKFPGYLLTA